MQKLALEEKLKIEYEQRITALEKQHAEDLSTIASQASQIEFLESEIEKRDRLINNFDTETIVDCIDKYNAETKDMLKRVLEKISADGNNGLAEYFLKEFNKKDQLISELLKKVNYLSLSATKKSEKYVPRDENGLADGQTLDKDDNTMKHPKKEDAKARGNNGAHHDPHNEVPCASDIIDNYPEGYDINDLDRYEIIEKKRRFQLILVPAHFRRQYYNNYKIYDKLEQKILVSSPINCPLRKSIYGCSILALVIVDKYGWHQTITVKVQQMRNMGFNANEGTIDGLIRKLSKSLFFRNLDKVLFIVVTSVVYALVDETFSKVRVDSAKLDGEFIKQCWFWGILAPSLKLVWYGCKDGSRRDEVGYELLKDLDHQMIIHTDGKSCYRNMGKDDKDFENIMRISCLQHQKRKLESLEDPRAKRLLEMYRNIYHMDHQRIEIATQDALNGHMWSEEEHIRWRKEHIYPEYLKLKEALIKTLENAPKSGDEISESSEQPLSKALESAIKYAINESKATESLFSCDTLCELDTNAIEIVNRAFSYHKKTSQAFGSIDAAENQAVFIALLESAKMFGINLYEYMTYLLEQMSKVDDYIITDANSKGFDTFRNMLPDKFAESHPKQTMTYDPPELPTGPLNPNSKRCGYKKRHGKDDGSKAGPPQMSESYHHSIPQTIMV